MPSGSHVGGELTHNIVCSFLCGDIKEIISIFLYVSGGVMASHKVSHMHIKMHILTSSLLFVQM